MYSKQAIEWKQNANRSNWKEGNGREKKKEYFHLLFAVLASAVVVLVLTWRGNNKTRAIAETREECSWILSWTIPFKRVYRCTYLWKLIYQLRDVLNVFIFFSMFLLLGKHICSHLYSHICVRFHAIHSVSLFRIISFGIRTSKTATYMKVETTMCLCLCVYAWTQASTHTAFLSLLRMNSIIKDCVTIHTLAAMTVHSARTLNRHTHTFICTYR